MTHDEIEAVAKTATLQTLQVLGFNVEDPPALRADMDHLRRWRLNVEAVGKASVTAIVLSICGLAVTALGYGIKAMLGR
jgi:hypothetical protein